MADQPEARTSGAIDPRILEQLEAVPLCADRPLLIVDADEVMVVFAAHLARFAAAEGLEMRLERYSLEGAFTERAGGGVLSFEDAIALIHRFVEAETHRQEALDGAPRSLARLAERAQIVVLTNVPRHGREARVENLSALGMGYPMVENGGGKGPVIAWLAERTGAPAIFLDDSPHQLASAKVSAPHVVRVHFVGAPMVAPIIPQCEAADHRVTTWSEAEALLTRLLA
ncbi:MAG: hypothetical protein AAGC57_15130 [Pseudomonadota bacterium]